ncbi:MAG: hypothetical protein HQK96_00935 [Nitrospirae bacterium]|nr:hypothetical protein [Nitrospirota bacterium]
MVIASNKDRVLWLTDVALCVFAAYIGWRCINYASGVLLPSDSAIFVNIAHHLIHGKLLYRDVWENKQPVVFAVNALALKLGDGTFNSIRAMERLFAAGAAIVFFIITVRTFLSSWIAAMFTIIFLVYFYSPMTFSMGNFTEEYASVFMLFGVLCALEAVWRENSFLVLLSGAFFSVSVLTKEPFLLSALPWMVYLLAGKAGKTSMQGRLKRFSIFFTAGAAVPLLSALAYFVFTGTLTNWLDVIYFNLTFSTHEPSYHNPLSQKIALSLHAFSTLVWFIRTVNVFFALGVISVFQKSFLRKYRYVPLILPIWFILSLLAVNIQNHHYNHYYIQVMPGFIMTAACGAAFMAFNMRRLLLPALSSVLIAAFLILSLLILDNTMARAGFNMLTKYTASTVAEEPISLYIKEHTKDNDTIWVPSYDKYIYLQSGRLTPTKYLFFFGMSFYPGMIETTGEKMASLKADLLKNRPAFIFLKRDNELDLLSPAGIPQWVKANYTLDSTWYDGQLLKRN